MKIALGIEYEGTDFFGWQAQESLITVQDCLEQALSTIAAEPIKTYCAGRTDAGVHANEQIVHFETNAKRPSNAWTLGTNNHLPQTITVKWVKEVNDSFHARFSAKARRYQYIIFNYSTRPAIYAKKAAHYYLPLNIEAMQEAATYLLGEHDFTSFRSAECEAKTAMREVQELTIVKQEPWIIITVQANAFLHHMVRNIVGTLLQVGLDNQSPNWMLDVLNAKDRRCAGETAPAHGLYLQKVIYPKEFDLPQAKNSILLF